MQMHRAIKPIALAASAVLGLGLATAAAADSHGDLVSALAKTSKSLVGEARATRSARWPRPTVSRIGPRPRPRRLAIPTATP